MCLILHVLAVLDDLVVREGPFDDGINALGRIGQGRLNLEVHRRLHGGVLLPPEFSSAMVSCLKYTPESICIHSLRRSLKVEPVDLAVVLVVIVVQRLGAHRGAVGFAGSVLVSWSSSWSSPAARADRSCS